MTQARQSHPLSPSFTDSPTLGTHTPPGSAIPPYFLLQAALGLLILRGASAPLEKVRTKEQAGGESSLFWAELLWLEGCGSVKPAEETVSFI